MVVVSLKASDKVSMMSALSHPLKGCGSSQSQRTILGFRFYLQQLSGQLGGHLEVIILSASKVPIQTLFSSNATYNEWVHGSTILPDLKSFYVMFEATIGNSFSSDVMLDDITVACDSNPLAESKPGICSFHTFHSLNYVLR